MMMRKKSGGTLLWATSMLLLFALIACAKEPQVYVLDSSKPVFLLKGEPAPAAGYWLSPGAMADLVVLAESAGN